jgi:hypothetical protein
VLEGVPPELDAAFRELRAKARAALVATKICRVRAVPDKDVVADGASVSVAIEFANVTSTTLHVPRAENGSSASVVVLTLVRDDYDVYGNVRSTKYTLPVPVLQDLDLAPGRTEKTRFTIPSDMIKLSHEGFSVIQIDGMFRPVVMRAGESEFFDAFPIEKAVIRVFQKGFEPLAQDPLGSLAKAVAKRSPPHVLVAAELLAPGDREAARTLLEAAKAKDEEMSVVIDAALARLPATR